jgi:hypothetical protein
MRRFLRAWLWCYAGLILLSSGRVPRVDLSASCRSAWQPLLPRLPQAHSSLWNAPSAQRHALVGHVRSSVSVTVSR